MSVSLRMRIRYSTLLLNTKCTNVFVQALFFKSNNGACVYDFFLFLIFFTACGEPLGFEDGRIPDSAFSTYKILKTGYEAYRARLNKATGLKSWCPPSKSNEAYLRIDLGKVHIIDGILTQGNPNNRLYYYTTTASASCKYVVTQLTTLVKNVWACVHIRAFS
jgi:hypothetical protein